MYQHRDWNGALLNLPSGKVVCVGKNYADHIQEMGGYAPKDPLLFIKPETSLCPLHQPLVLPVGLGQIHHEVELAVLIGSPLKQASESDVAKAIVGYGIALDLTLRELQGELKKSAEPWEKAKAFDGACPVSGFIPLTEFGDPQQATLSLTINGDLRQSGNSGQMITPILPLITYITRFFTLRPGDIVLTGTPSGVGQISHGDNLKLSLNGRDIVSSVI